MLSWKNYSDEMQAQRSRYFSFTRTIFFPFLHLKNREHTTQKTSVNSCKETTLHFSESPSALLREQRPTCLSAEQAIVYRFGGSGTGCVNGVCLTTWVGYAL